MRNLKALSPIMLDKDAKYFNSKGVEVKAGQHSFMTTSPYAVGEVFQASDAIAEQLIASGAAIAVAPVEVPVTKQE